MNRNLSSLLILILLGGFLASCGKQPPREELNNITFMYWGTPKEQAVVRENIKEFESMHPEIQVQEITVEIGKYFQKLLTMMAGHSAPDVIYLLNPFIYKFASRDSLLDLKPLIEKDGIDMKQFIPQVVKISKYNDRIYGFPLYHSTMVLHYNKDMFDKEGIPYPDESWDWEKFLEAAKRLTKDTDRDGRIDQYGFIAFPNNWDHFAPFIFQNGGTFGEDGYFYTGPAGDIEASAEAVQFYVDLMYKYKVAPTGHTYKQIDQITFFASGRGAMLISGLWAAVEFKRKVTDFNWDITVVPHHKQRGTTFYFTVAAIPKQSKKQEAAWELIKFLNKARERSIPSYVSEERQKEWFKAMGLLDINYRAFIDCLEYAIPIPYLKEDYEEILEAETGLIWINQESVRDAFERAQRRIRGVNEGN